MVVLVLSVPPPLGILMVRFLLGVLRDKLGVAETLARLKLMILADASIIARIVKPWKLSLR